MLDGLRQGLVILLLRTLDTAVDLIAYLSKKEQLLLSGRLNFATGEEALLGLYLSHTGPDEQHEFALPDGGPVNIDESWWHRYIASPEAAAKRKADAISYMWDALIERFAHHFREGTADHLSHNDAAEHATILRFYAKKSRLRRRILAKNIIEILKTTEPHLRRLRVIPPTRAGEPYWLLLAFPFLRTASYETNRITRRWFLNACAPVTKLMYPDALDIVGFATDSGLGQSRSEDAIYFDARTWTSDMDVEARELQREHRILVKANEIRWTENDYPQPDL